MARPSGPVTGNSREVVSSGSSSFTGTSSGTSALRVPPEGRTIVTGTSGMADLLSKRSGWDCVVQNRFATREVGYLMLILNFGLGLFSAGATGFTSGLAAGLGAGAGVEVSLMLGRFTSGVLAGAAEAFSLTRSGRSSSRVSTGKISGCFLRYSRLQRAASGSQGKGGLVG